MASNNTSYEHCGGLANIVHMGKFASFRVAAFRRDYSRQTTATG